MDFKKIVSIGGGFATLFAVLFFSVPGTVYAARLLLSPSSGTFTVGSTFEVSVLLDTEEQSINAFELFLKFPPDKLQISSPSTGQSIVKVWTGPPHYNNQEGFVELRGGIPNGINVNQGLISKLTFRVKQVGNAVLKFGDETRVLLNDGKGTDALRDVQNGVYEFTLPPPAGPIVASETHPDQSKWYPLTTGILRWETDLGAGGYSYVLSRDAIEVPDKISEGTNQSVAYKNLDNGTHYFHIRAQRDGVFGGITHFSLNVDKEPPALFSVEVSPAPRTTRTRPIISFSSPDAHSGISHYEYKTVSLKPAKVGQQIQTPFFIETLGTEVLTLDKGSYDIIARAYDKAGNFTEVVQRIDVVTALFQFIEGEGVRFAGAIVIPWLWFFLISLIVILLLLYGGWRVREWHHKIIARHGEKELPNEVRQRLDELHKYRQKYGKMTLFLLIFSSLFFGVYNGEGTVAYAQNIELAPPFISTISRDISNEEIFYIGGKTDAANIDVLIYLQNLSSGETMSQSVVSNKKNEWFYRHGTFLPTGNYLLWTQTRIGDQLSPPSPQINMTVRPTAIQFGASRLSFEVLYLIASLALLLVVVGLVTHIVFHGYHGRKKHLMFIKEVREAEESVRRGFAVLKRDIQAELDIVRQMKLSKALSEEEAKREEQLLKDLEWAEQYIGKEIWDIERIGDR